MTLNYLRGLYGDKLPRLLYLYHVGRPVQQVLAYDPLLRLLTTGTATPLASPQAQLQAVAAFEGTGAAACPILARGNEWRVFDMTPIMPLLLPLLNQAPIPTLKDMPAPR